MLLIVSTQAKVMSTEGDSELHLLESRLNTLLNRAGIQPEIEHCEKTNKVTIRFETRQYIIHRNSMAGGFSREAYIKEGPSWRGVLLTAQLHEKGQSYQALMPQTLTRPYWKTYFDLTELPNHNKNLYWSLSYGSQFSQPVRMQIIDVLRGVQDIPDSAQ